MVQDTNYSNKKHFLVLKDGRKLAFTLGGDANGMPLFFFHGLPGSAIEIAHLEDAARARGVQLIGIDRPGFGDSDYQPRRHILDFTDDVVELANHLGFDRFGVAGLSAGGVYTLACAATIPERLTVCGIISGAGDKGPKARILGRFMPFVMMPWLARMFTRSDDAEQFLVEKMADGMSAADREALKKGSTASIMAASIIDGFRQGGKAAALDGKLISGDYGFDLADIAFENIHLWHGEADEQMPIAVAKNTVARLAHCTPYYYPDEGHTSVIVNHADEIVGALARSSGAC